MTVRWGILGPGGIAKRFFRSAQGSTTGAIVAIGTRDPARPGLSQDFPGTVVHGSYDALLADRDVDAIYIATPHIFHAEWAKRAVRAGKHVLCEKPLGMSAVETTAVFAAARDAGVFMGEAFMYRHHPLTRFLLDFVGSGRLGQVRLIKSSFGFAVADPDPGHRLFAPELGGGAILDIGCYPVSVSRLLAGYQTDGRVIDPDRLVATGTIGPTGVDTFASALLRFPNAVVAEISASIVLEQDNLLQVVGTLGRLEVDRFWVGTGTEGGSKIVRFHALDGSIDHITVTEDGYLYSFQFEAANEAIAQGRDRFVSPGMDEADSIGNAHVLDDWLAAIR